jgi:hypothetical protein
MEGWIRHMRVTSRMRAAHEALARLKARTAGSTSQTRKQGPVKSEPAWSADRFMRELERAKRVGPAGLSDAELLRFCQEGHRFVTHFWIDAGPFFVELWRRIEEHRFANVRTKEEACRLLGCSSRWARMIVAGTARESNKHKATKARTEVSSCAPKQQSDEDFADDIARYARDRLQLLTARNSPRLPEIRTSLEEHFAEASTRRKP